MTTALSKPSFKLYVTEAGVRLLQSDVGDWQFDDTAAAIKFAYEQADFEGEQVEVLDEKGRRLMVVNL